jgi:hypothetical protein
LVATASVVAATACVVASTASSANTNAGASSDAKMNFFIVTPL